MNVLSIHTERAQIEINSVPARVSIEHNHPAFNIRRDMPRMQIERKLPTFQVDAKQANADRGRPSAAMLNQKFVQQSRQKAMEAVGDIVQRGDILKDSENPNALAQVAVSLSVKDMPELNIGLMPREKARIEWDPGYCTIEWTDPVLQIEWDKEFMPTIEWEPYAVEVRLRNRPLVKIRVNLAMLPGEHGLKLDEEI